MSEEQEQKEVVSGETTPEEQAEAIKQVQDAMKAGKESGDEGSTEPEEKPEPRDEETPSEEKSIDYKALAKKYEESLEREKEIRKHEREKAKRLKKQLKKSSQDEDIPESTEDNSGDIHTLINEALDEKLDSVRSEFTQSFYEDALDEVTQNPDERELVDTVYKSVIRSTGTSRKDITDAVKRAWLIAHEDHIEEVARRKARADIRKGEAEKAALTQGKAPSSRKSPSSKSKLSPEEQALFDNLGVSPEVRDEMLKKNGLI